MKRVSAAGAPSIECLAVLIHPCTITACMCIFKLARLQFPNLLDHSLQMHLQTRSITASKCISKLARSRPPSASPKSLDHGLQVHLQTHSIMVAKLTRSQPPSVSPISLDYCIQVCTIMATKFIYTLALSLPPSASPNSLDHGIGVYPSVYSIVISRRTSNCSQALPAASSDIYTVCRWVAIWIHTYIAGNTN
jgi:hypothetical protein